MEKYSIEQIANLVEDFVKEFNIIKIKVLEPVLDSLTDLETVFIFNNMYFKVICYKSPVTSINYNFSKLIKVKPINKKITSYE